MSRNNDILVGIHYEVVKPLSNFASYKQVHPFSNKQENREHRISERLRIPQNRFGQRQEYSRRKKRMDREGNACFHSITNVRTRVKVQTAREFSVSKKLRNCLDGTTFVEAQQRNKL